MYALVACEYLYARKSEAAPYEATKLAYQPVSSANGKYNQSERDPGQPEQRRELWSNKLRQVYELLEQNESSSFMGISDQGKMGRLVGEIKDLDRDIEKEFAATEANEEQGFLG